MSTKALWLPSVKSAVVSQEGGKWVLKTRDGKRVLGTHDTPDAAYRQEYAIQMSKKKKEGQPVKESALQRSDILPGLAFSGVGALVGGGLGHAYHKDREMFDEQAGSEEEEARRHRRRVAIGAVLGALTAGAAGTVGRVGTRAAKAREEAERLDLLKADILARAGRDYGAATMDLVQHLDAQMNGRFVDQMALMRAARSAHEALLRSKAIRPDASIDQDFIEQGLREWDKNPSWEIPAEAYEVMDTSRLPQAEIRWTNPADYEAALSSVKGAAWLPVKQAAKREDLLKAIRAAEASVERNPTDEQKKCGNYRKGHFRMHGLGITIENPKGSFRSGVAKDGTEWSTKMKHTYGYIKRTLSEADEDHCDVFIGDNPESELVVVVDQFSPGSGRFDEHKIMLGFTSEEAARAGYLACYEDGWKGLGATTVLTMDQFKDWLVNGDTGKALSRQSSGKGLFSKAAWHPALSTVGGAALGGAAGLFAGRKLEKKRDKLLAAGAGAAVGGLAGYGGHKAVEYLRRPAVPVPATPVTVETPNVDTTVGKALDTAGVSAPVQATIKDTLEQLRTGNTTVTRLSDENMAPGTLTTAVKKLRDSGLQDDQINQAYTAALPDLEQLANPNEAWAKLTVNQNTLPVYRVLLGDYLLELLSHNQRSGLFRDSVLKKGNSITISVDKAALLEKLQAGGADPSIMELLQVNAAPAGSSDIFYDPFAKASAAWRNPVAAELAGAAGGAAQTMSELAATRAASRAFSRAEQAGDTLSQPAVETALRQLGLSTPVGRAPFRGGGPAVQVAGPERRLLWSGGSVNALRHELGHLQQPSSFFRTAPAGFLAAADPGVPYDLGYSIGQGKRPGAGLLSRAAGYAAGAAHQPLVEADAWRRAAKLSDNPAMTLREGLPYWATYAAPPVAGASAQFLTGYAAGRGGMPDNSNRFYTAVARGVPLYSAARRFPAALADAASVAPPVAPIAREALSGALSGLTHGVAEGRFSRAKPVSRNALMRGYGTADALMSGWTNLHEGDALRGRLADAALNKTLQTVGESAVRKNVVGPLVQQATEGVLPRVAVNTVAATGIRKALSTGQRLVGGAGGRVAGPLGYLTASGGVDLLNAARTGGRNFRDLATAGSALTDVSHGLRNPAVYRANLVNRAGLLAAHPLTYGVGAVMRPDVRNFVSTTARDLYRAAVPRRSLVDTAGSIPEGTRGFSIPHGVTWRPSP